MDSQERTPGGKLRARGLGIQFDGEPGKNGAITDGGDVQVGYATLIRGEGALVRGQGPVRTGVTAILPRGRPAPAAARLRRAQPRAAGTISSITWPSGSCTHIWPCSAPRPSTSSPCASSRALVTS